MTKTSLLLLISFLVFQPLNAQLDSLVDVFPLAVGNQWTYGYYHFYEGWMGFWYIDTGSVNARVAGMSPTQDSTQWLFHETRDIITHVYPTGQTYRTLDSSDYRTTEYQSGRHQLIIDSGYSWVFLLSSSPPDTSWIVCRYQVVDSSGNARVVNRFPPGLADTLVFHSGIGLVRRRRLATLDELNVQLRTSMLVSVDPWFSNPSIGDYSLSQNYPNPFNPTTIIEFAVPHEANVTLKLYDVLGREVMTLVEDKLEGGTHSAAFNAEQLASGIYFYRLRAGDFIATRKLLYLK